MADKTPWKVVGISAFTFVALLTALTAMRVWNLEPPTPVQSLMVNVTALSTIICISYYVYQGGNFIGSLTLALGPSLAFTFNLFIPVSRMETALWVLYPLVGALTIAAVLGAVGFIVGHVGKKRREHYLS